ncbi:MAG: hypothetical protein RL475_171, partial [Actinomycetota bacterium]
RLDPPWVLLCFKFQGASAQLGAVTTRKAKQMNLRSKFTDENIWKPLPRTIVPRRVVNS